MVLIWVLLFCRLVSVVLTTVGHSERSLQSTSQLGKCCCYLCPAAYCNQFYTKALKPSKFEVHYFHSISCSAAYQSLLSWTALPYVFHTLASFPGPIPSFSMLHAERIGEPWNEAITHCSFFSMQDITSVNHCAALWCCCLYWWHDRSRWPMQLWVGDVA